MIIQFEPAEIDGLIEALTFAIAAASGEGAKADWSALLKDLERVKATVFA
jgi:hypothetical protein